MHMLVMNVYTVLWLMAVSLFWRSISVLFTITDETIYTNVTAGVLSGAISSSVANPTDVLKVSLSSPPHTHHIIVSTSLNQCSTLFDYQFRISQYNAV